MSCERRPRRWKSAPRCRDGALLGALLAVLIAGAWVSALRRPALAESADTRPSPPVPRDALLAAESAGALGWERVLEVVSGPDRVLAGGAAGRVAPTLGGARQRLAGAGLEDGASRRLNVSRAGRRGTGAYAESRARVIVGRRDHGDERTVLQVTVDLPCGTCPSPGRVVLGRAWVLSSRADPRGVFAEFAVQHAYVEPSATP